MILQGYHGFCLVLVLEVYSCDLGGIELDLGLTVRVFQGLRF